MSKRSEQNLAVAKKYIDGVLTGDLSVIDETMTADVNYTVISAASPHSSAAIPWSGNHRGREAVKAYQRRLGAAQNSRVDGIERWVADNDTVVGFATVQAQSPKTGRSGTWEIAFRFDFSDGLISNYFLYEDSFSAAIVHSVGGALQILDVEGERYAPELQNIG